MRNTYTRHNSRTNDPILTLRRSLQSNSQHTPQRSGLERDDSSHLIGEPSRQYTTHKSAEVVNACDASLCQHTIGLTTVIDRNADEIEIVWGAVYNSDYTLRVALVSYCAGIGNEDARRD